MRKVFGLVGPSGTGKSYSSERIIRSLGVNLVIDDGLLIRNHEMVAGTSAKLEKHLLSATKRALFIDKTQRWEVQEKLAMNPEEPVLIIGTSDKMVQKICTYLNIKFPITWLDIKDYTSENERALAMLYRQRGFHAIPVIEVQFQHASKERFSLWLKKQVMQHRFLSTINRDLPLLSTPAQKITIVTPLFGRGLLTIHPRTVKDFIENLISDVHYPFSLTRVLYDLQNPQILSLHLKVHLVPHLDAYMNQFLSAIRENGLTQLGVPFQDITLYVDSAY